MTDDKISDRISSLRKGMMNKDFAKMVGMSESVASRWCSGHTEPSASAIRLICISCDVSANWLLDLDAEDCPNCHEDLA